MLRARVLRLLVAAAVAATAPAARAEAPEPLRYELAADLVVTAGAGAFYLLTEIFNEHVGPRECRWCTVNGLDASIREDLVWDEPKSARAASDVVAFGIVPAAVLGHALLAAREAGDLGAGWVDLLLVAQAAAIAVDLNQLTKVAVGRQRPFAHFGNYEDPDRAPERDDNWSFYSGHVSLAFSLVAAAGTVSTMRGYSSAPWVWGVGMALAASVAWFRVAGDMHYFTDVLTGAAVGTAVGAAVPWLFHRPARAEERGGGVRVLPTLGGVLVIF